VGGTRRGGHRGRRTTTTSPTWRACSTTNAASGWSKASHRDTPITRGCRFSAQVHPDQVLRAHRPGIRTCSKQSLRRDGEGETTAVFSISHEEAAKAVADDPAIYEEVWCPGATKSFVGLRVDLAKVPEERVQELVEHAWRNKAANRMVAAYDAQYGVVASELLRIPRLVGVRRTPLTPPADGASVGSNLVAGAVLCVSAQRSSGASGSPGTGADDDRIASSRGHGSRLGDRPTAGRDRTRRTAAESMGRWCH
jgi:hypothetical protein